ncbi:potassium channel family protein [Lacibacter sediminis]|uniref:NAD-binding protein n=1 Tax=Lacibacter sediminis TaxID=2760713 RepID=A0A7G5XG54_9BACT|nr:potassium channel protein [Lacibacter sediminis]QNA44457.1 NAD-binding protein [Lacibacter sediminis]
MMYFLRLLKYFKGLLVPISLFVVLLFIGTAGYMIIESYDLLDAFYMTVITVGTVGYLEVQPLSDAGRIFTSVIIIINIGAFTFFVTYLTRYLLDGEFIRQYKHLKMDNAIHQLNNHVIVCGFGRNGTQCAHILHDNHIPFVVLEEKIDLPESLPFEVKHFVKGDATTDESLLHAGIKRARAIIATMPVDADNLFMVLTARQLNPNIVIISRASHDSSVNKLRVAGANNVIMPDKIGGAHMATMVLIPDVAELLSLMSTRNTTEFKIEEIIANNSIQLGELNLWKNSGCTILGIKSKGNYILNPGPSHSIAEGERLIIMGSEYQIRKAKELV